MRYEKLFSPIHLGSVEIKNRIFMSPMHVNLSESPNGHFTKRYIDYYRERARGGVGLIITGHVKAERTVDPYPCLSRFPCLDRLDEVKYFAELVEAVHLYGAKIAVELSAGTGRIADCIVDGHYPSAPSEVPLLINPKMNSRALTPDTIRQLIDAYGVAAANAKAAGFDFIYIHASAYLMDQFLTPCWNQRTDEYGGSIENRMRFMMECIDSARRHVGTDFPLIAGFAMDQGVANGKSRDDCVAIARGLEAKGILALHLRHGSYDAMNLLIPTNLDTTEIAVDDAAAIRAEVSIPVLVDGALLSPDVCERILQEGRADMTGIARPLLADPEWVGKARSGKAEDIRPCLRCMECINRVSLRKYSGCSVNPLMGREQEGHERKAARSKKVLVIGAGQSGLLTALYASQFGHQVTLVEKKASLGGHMLEGSAPPFKKETARYLGWVLRQLEKTDATVKTGITVDRGFVESLAPDAVVLCSGSVTSVPDVPGIKGPNVRLATDVLMDSSDTGSHVVIVGAGLVGCETALDLARKGKKVTLVEMLPRIGTGIILMAKGAYLSAIHKAGIECRTNVKLAEVIADGIRVADPGGQIHEIKADTVVMATGLRSEDKLYGELSQSVQEIYRAGDCLSPRKFIDAGREAYAIAILL